MVALDGIWQWFDEHSGLLGWSLAVSLGSLVITLVLLPVIVVKLPADYFVASRRELVARASVGRLLLSLGKNLLGAVFLLAGFAMLFLPGQGLLTMLIGLLLLDFPGKRRVERKIVRRPSVLAFLNRMRERHGQLPLQVD
jgi:hypothetical protein